MRNKAYRLTAYTAVISAAGFLLRWLQNIRILDAETGLASRGMPISFIVAGVIVLAAASFALFAASLKQYAAPAEPETALRGETIFHTLICLVPVLLLAVSGAAQLLGATEENWAMNQLTIRKILGVAAVVAAIALLLIVANRKQPEKSGLCRVCMAVLILFAGVWLIAVYKTAASDPVLWRFAVEILAICASLLAFYHIAGYYYGQPSPRMSVFYCNLGAFLCVMSAIDDHPMADSICYAAVALLQLIWSYSVIANLGPRLQELPTAGEASAPRPEAPADEPQDI